MSTVISKDGTRIAYDKVGSGSAVILVDGALVYRDFWGQRPLAALLAGRFTVYTYDRRGRGESGNTLPYSVQREVEDIEALIDEAGGSAYLYGASSGAALAMEAAIRLGDKVKKLAMYEAPYNSDPTAQERWKEYTHQLDALLAADRRGDAVILFMMLTGATAEQADGQRQTPVFQKMEAVAHTLAYDHTAILGESASVPVERAAQLTVPALVIDGSASFPFMHDSATALARAMANARQYTLEGQTHEVAPEVLAPVLAEFFASNGHPVAVQRHEEKSRWER